MILGMLRHIMGSRKTVPRKKGKYHKEKVEKVLE